MHEKKLPVPVYEEAASLTQPRNVLFLGPPGTAKSLLARRMARVCGGEYFERLLTRFSAHRLCWKKTFLNTD